MKLRLTQKGLTLLELLIVLAIVGIISKLSSTLHESSKRKSLQSEAKFSLASIYNLEKSFYSEFGSYIPDLYSIGYGQEGGGEAVFAVSLTGNHYYEIGWWPSWSYNVTGFSAVHNRPLTYHNTFGSLVNCAALRMDCDDPPMNTNDPQSFKVMALGQLGYGINCDAWSMDNLKRMQNIQVGY